MKKRIERYESPATMLQDLQTIALLCQSGQLSSTTEDYSSETYEW